MSFEDELRDKFQRADAALPDRPLSWNATITQARRTRMRYVLATTVAAACVIGAGIFFISTQTNEPQSRVVPPAGSSGASASPVTSPTPSPSETKAANCSASPDRLAPSAYEQQTPPPAAVTDTMTEIISAATSCDYRRLGQLALAGRQGFTFSYGSETEPGKFWRDREREARKKHIATSEYMRYLVQVLSLPYCHERGPDGSNNKTVMYYEWPRVQCRHRTTADWQDLKGLYTQKQIDQMRLGDIYYGFRVGITVDGDWVYFVAGD
jgi:hypothetical protein